MRTPLTSLRSKRKASSSLASPARGPAPPRPIGPLPAAGGGEEEEALLHRKEERLCRVGEEVALR